jgi:hypothetical protein
VHSPYHSSKKRVAQRIWRREARERSFESWGAQRLKLLVLVGVRVPTTVLRSSQGGGAGLLDEGETISERRTKGNGSDAPCFPLLSPPRVTLGPSAEAAVGGSRRGEEDDSLPPSFSLSCSAAQLEEWRESQ